MLVPRRASAIETELAHALGTAHGHVALEKNTVAPSALGGTLLAPLLTCVLAIRNHG